LTSRGNGVERSLVRALAGLAVVGALVLAPTGTAAGQDPTPPACGGFSRGTEAGTVGDPEVVELSGIVASRAHPGVLWVHNDSGGASEVAALSSTGEALGHFAIEGAEAVDWEDIGIGPGPEEGRSYLYLADIGDNASTREHVTVYVAAEPDAAPDGDDDSLPLVEELTIRYPDGPSDAESLFVDPLEGDLYIITKNVSGASRVLRASAGTVSAGGQITMEDVGGIGAEQGLPPTIATAADIAPDGSTVLVRTYQDVLVFRRPAGQPLAAAFEAAPCSAPSEAEPQGEAIAFSADGAAYLTSSEGAAQPLYRFGVDPPLVPTTTTGPARSMPLAESDNSSSGVPVVVVIVLAVAALVVVAAVVVLRSRRTVRG
jgi:hypothetical protein